MGNVILEYLPWHHYRVRRDLLELVGHVTRGTPFRFVPADDRFRDHPDCWGFTVEEAP
jgi:hypothetical protein